MKSMARPPRPVPFVGSAGAAGGRNGFAVLLFVAAVPVHPPAALLLPLPLRNGPRQARPRNGDFDMSSTENQRGDLYSRITDKIVEDLAKGVRPWMKPWNAAKAAGRITRPLRYNGQPYSGVNVLLLWSEGIARGYTSSTWMTSKQSLELGAAVRKGETGTTVVFASRFTKSETDGNGGEVEREIPFLKAYSVFNVEQIDGLPEQYHHRPGPVPDPVKRIEHVDRFFRNTGASVRHGGNQAFFSPAADLIQMPLFESFKDAASYYATLSHEVTHYAGFLIMPREGFGAGEEPRLQRRISA